MAVPTTSPWAEDRCPRALGSAPVDVVGRETLLGTSAGVSHGSDRAHASVQVSKGVFISEAQVYERKRGCLVSMQVVHSHGCGNATSCHLSLNDHVLIVSNEEQR